MRYVYGEPHLKGSIENPNNGIRQVIYHLHKHLPDFGYQLTDNPDKPDLVLAHAASGNGYCDILYSHGLYPTYKLKGDQYNAINSGVIHNARVAKAVITPSQWVADLFRRDMHLSPYVIQHGVDLTLWGDNEAVPGSYILWNKGRPTDVCDPSWAVKLAKMNPNLQFISTFGAELPNMKLTGATAYDDMVKLVKGASIYLATTKETGDIASREALAAGIPVLSFNHGASPDFIVHGYNGYLATPDNIDSLNAGLHWLIRNWHKVSKNAKESSKGMSWANTAKQVASVFDKVLTPNDSRVKVSIVVPCFNYGHFIEQALDSIAAQKTSFPFELIIVNDGSTDDSEKIIDKWVDNHPDIYATSIHQENRGVAHARNKGITYATGEFIVCLDADDQMGENFLQICHDELAKNRALGIVYTRLQTDSGYISKWLEGQFDFEQQIKGANQIPSLCMFRKEAWERVGGFRQRYSPAEDADLWTRITAFGYQAKKVSDQPLFIYRYHDASLSAPYRGDGKKPAKAMPNWSGDKGFLQYMPFAAPSKTGYHAVRNYDNPDVDVIIPVGRGHDKYVCDAIDSVEQQNYWNWRLIIANNTGTSLNHLLKAYPFLQIVDAPEKFSAAYARNKGLEVASAPLTLFLDADDYLFPEYLSKAIRAFRETGNYIYTDWLKLQGGLLSAHETPNFNKDGIFHKGSIHAITALIPTKEAKLVKFDETLPAWEDWQFFLDLVAYGICGKRLPEPLFVYRFDTGKLRELGVELEKQLKPVLFERYKDFIEGRRVVACGCSQLKKVTPDLANLGEQVKVEYHGALGKHEVRGQVSNTFYGRKQRGDIFYIYRQDFDPRDDKFTLVEEIELAPEMQPIPMDLV